MPDDKPLKNQRENQRARGARRRPGQQITINGIAGKVTRPGRMIDADSVRDNPAFDPNYESEQGGYNGPVWHPLDTA